jgi:hypothetical protein
MLSVGVQISHRQQITGDRPQQQSKHLVECLLQRVLTWKISQVRIVIVIPIAASIIVITLQELGSRLDFIPRHVLSSRSSGTASIFDRMGEALPPSSHEQGERPSKGRVNHVRHDNVE